MPISIDIPAAWERLNLERLEGVNLIVGATDTGKSTFARYLFQRFASLPGSTAAFLDADPGQSVFGPPTTQTLVWDLTRRADLVAPRRCFVGSTTPSGHFLPALVGVARLVQAAAEAHSPATHIVVDTSGMIDPQSGGLALKLAKIELLRPAAVFAIQEDQELEPLLRPLRRSRWTQVFMLEPAPAAGRRSREVRRAYRRSAFARYFASARLLEVSWKQLAVLPAPRFSLHRLVSIEGSDGFSRGLGIIVDIDRPGRRLQLLTPLLSLEGVTVLRVGDVRVDPQSFADSRIDQ